NVIIGNPPFTRIERLEEKYKDDLSKIHRLDKFMFGQAGLHVGFIIHGEQFLEKGGILSMVLPTASFSSNYSRALEKFILDNFKILYIIDSRKDITFSDGSDFKEILFICEKIKDSEESPEEEIKELDNEKQPKNLPINNNQEDSSIWTGKYVVLKKSLKDYALPMLATVIQKKNENYEDEQLSIRLVSKDEFISQTNWLMFARAKLEDLVNKIYESKLFSLQNKIIVFHEGFHLDAPYFFRIPNEFWDVVTDTELLIRIKNKANEKIEYKIPKRFVVECLDVPSNYNTNAPKMNNYLLNIKHSDVKNLGDGLKKYIEWGEDIQKCGMTPKEKNTKSPPELSKIKKYAEKRKDKPAYPWYTYGSHILTHQRIDKTVGPIGGNIALVEKFRTKTVNNVAFYSSGRLTGSNSFFFGEILIDKKYKKILGAWFCSTWYLMQYLYNRREISGNYGRIKIKDFKSWKCINPQKIKKEYLQEIEVAFNEYREGFPTDKTFYEQIKERNPKLKNLDFLFLKSLELKFKDETDADFLENVYNLIIEEIDISELGKAISKRRAQLKKKKKKTKKKENKTKPTKKLDSFLDKK
ncbi:MAG: Eco57I restriction-modification methylase domain-containing protein, partial [Candidatus Hodarchaeota archaeon]